MRLLCVLLVTFAFSGCCNLPPQNAQDIVEFARHRHSVQGRGRPVQNLLWYMGTLDGRDYFKYVYGMAAEKYFEVSSGEVYLQSSFDLTADYTKWVPVRAIGDYQFWTPDNPQ